MAEYIWNNVRRECHHLSRSPLDEFVCACTGIFRPIIRPMPEAPATAEPASILPCCCAALLIGGESRRMGRDKALLPTESGPLFAVIARRLQEAFREIRPIGTLSEELPDVPGLPILPAVPDSLSERSSLNGVLTALETATNAWVAVFACDMPLVSISLLHHMAELRRGDVDVIALEDERGEVQPFHAFWHTRCAPTLRAAAARGELSLRKAMDKLSVLTIPRETWMRFDPDGQFLRNLNSPEEFEQFQATTTR